MGTPTGGGGLTFNPPTATVGAGSSSASFTVSIPASATGSVNLSFTGVAQGGSLPVNAGSSISLSTPFSLGSSTATGFAGQTVQLIVPVTRNAGFTNAVTVTAASGIAGVTITPGSMTVSGTTTQAVFVATIPATATSGTINFNGTTSGLPQVANATISLTINAPFTISLGAKAGAAIAGATVQTTVNVGLTGGFAGPVALTVASVGAGTGTLGTTSFSASGTSQLTMGTPAGTPPGTTVVTVTGSAGSYTATASYTLTTQVAFSAQQNSPSNMTLYRGYGGQVVLAVTYSSSFSGIVTATTNTPNGISAQVTSPNPLTIDGNVIVQLSAGQNAQSGTVNVILTGGGNTLTFPVTITAVDPYSLATTLPLMPVGSTSGVYTVTLTAATGFAGSVMLTPSITAVGGTATGTIQPGRVVNLISGQVLATNFTLTIGGGVTSVNLGMTTSSGGFTLNQAPQQVAVGAAFTMSNNGPFKAFSGVSTQFTVTVNFGNGYTNPVTVTPSVPSGMASISPSSATATPGSPTVTFTATGTASNVNAISGSTSIAGNDGQGNIGTTSLFYSVVDPYTLSTTLPSMPAASTSGSYVVTVTAAIGFAGTVHVTGAVTSVGGTGSPGISAAQDLTLSSGGVQSATFTVSINAGVTGINLSAATSTSSFTLNQPVQAAMVGPAFTMSNGGALKAFSGVGRTFTVTVNFANGYTNPVTVTPSIQPGLTAYSPITATATPASPTVTFTATGTSTNPSLVTGTIPVSGNDGLGNTGSTSFSYTVVDPYVFSTVLPNMPVDSTTGTYSVTVTAALGFAGTVRVAPTLSTTGGTGTPSISAAQNLSLTSGASLTANFTVTINAAATGLTLTAFTSTGSFTLNSSAQSVSVGAAFTMNVSSFSLFLGIVTSQTVTVNFAPGYTHPVTVLPPPSLPFFLTSITPSSGQATPSSPSVTFDVLSLLIGSGTLTFTGSDGQGNTASTNGMAASMNPFTITSSVPPSSPTASTSQTYSVTIQAANGFAGTVLVTPGVTGVVGGTVGISAAQTLTLSSGGSATANFTLTIGAGVTSMTLDAVASITNFSQNTTSAATAVGPAFTMTNSGALQLFSSTGKQFTITVIFPTGYTNTVTVLAPTGVAGISSFSTSSALATPASPTVTFTANPGSSIPTLISGNASFSAHDSVSNGGSTSVPYTVVDPYSISTILPSMPAGSTTGTYSVVVTAAIGFNGTVTVSATVTSTTGTGTPTASGPQTFTISSGATSTRNFTITVNAGATSINLSTTTSSGSFNLNRGPQSVAVSAAFTITAGTPLSFTGVPTPFTVTVNFANGFTNSVTVFASSLAPTFASISGASLIATPASPTVTFTVTGVALGGGSFLIQGSDVAGNVGSTGANFTTVNPFTVALTSASAANFSVPAPGTNQFTVNVTFASGFAGTVEVQPPSGSQFTVAPTSITLTASGSAVFTITGLNAMALTSETVRSATPSVANPSYTALNLVKFDVITFGLQVLTVPSPLFIGDNRTITLALNTSGSTFYGSATFTSSTPSAPFTGFTVLGTGIVDMSGGGSANFGFTPAITGTDADAGSKTLGGFSFTLSGSPNVQATLNFGSTSNVTVTAPFTTSGQVFSSPAGTGSNVVYRGGPGTGTSNETFVGVSFTSNGFVAAFGASTQTVSFMPSGPSGSSLQACFASVCNNPTISSSLTDSSSTVQWVAQASNTEASGNKAFSFTSTWNGPGGTYTQTVSATVNVVITFSYLPNPNPIQLYNGNSTSFTFGITAGTGFTGSMTVTLQSVPTGVVSVTPTTRTFPVGRSGQFNILADNSSSVSGGSITFTIASSDGFSSVPISITYNESPPFSAALTQLSVTLAPLQGQTITMSNIALTAGFTGSVVVTPAGSGSTSGTLPIGITQCSLPTLTFTTSNPSAQTGCYSAASYGGGASQSAYDQVIFTSGSYVLSLPFNIYTTPSIEPMSRRRNLAAGSFRSSSQDVTITPSLPRIGDDVTFRFRVKNAESDTRTARVLLLRGDSVIDQQTVAVSGGGSSVAKLSWRAESLAGQVLTLKLVDGDASDLLPLSSFRLDTGTSRRDRMSVNARNEDCTGVRLRSASQSGCGGSTDLEFQPMITAAGKLDIQVLVPDGGMRDVGGFASLPTSIDASLDTSNLSPRGMLEQGHTYVVKSGGRVAIVRVVRVRSSVNPKLGALLGGGSSGVVGGKGSTPISTGGHSGSGGDILGTIKDQNQADQILGSAQIQIDLEWVATDR